jgi:hypothetical protein
MRAAVVQQFGCLGDADQIIHCIWLAGGFQAELFNLSKMSYPCTSAQQLGVSYSVTLASDR